MADFPLFISLKDRKCLIVGGGKVAARKAETLLKFGADLTVVAKETDEAMELLRWKMLPGSVTILSREWEEGDAEGKFLVIAATDDPELNHIIAVKASENGSFADSATDREDCTFLFPSVISDGDLVVGISTAGSSPAFSRALREKIEAVLPMKTGERLTVLEQVREQVFSMTEDRKKRKKIMDSLAEDALSEEEFTFSDCMEKAGKMM